jgi:hypothetical protein
MITLEQALEILRRDALDPEDFSIENGELIWQHDFGMVDEPGDVAWDCHCEASYFVRQLLGEDFVEIDEAWADNDTVGFTIKLIYPS